MSSQVEYFPPPPDIFPHMKEADPARAEHTVRTARWKELFQSVSLWYSSLDPSAPFDHMKLPFGAAFGDADSISVLYYSQPGTQHT